MGWRWKITLTVRLRHKSRSNHYCKDSGSWFIVCMSWVTCYFIKGWFMGTWRRPIWFIKMNRFTWLTLGSVMSRTLFKIGLSTCMCLRGLLFPLILNFRRSLVKFSLPTMRRLCLRDLRLSGKEEGRKLLLDEQWWHFCFVMIGSIVGFLFVWHIKKRINQKWF